MRVFLGIGLLFLVFCGPANSQGCGPQNANCIVPTAPPGTSNNQAASTAFVTTAVTTSKALAQYHFFIGNVSNVAVDTALSGDCVYGALGIICTKTNNVSFGYFATGTNLSNLTGSLTANLPLIGSGGAIGQGTRSGNTTVFGTTSGSLTSGNCIKADASGNLVDAGAACSTGVLTPGTVYVTSTGTGTYVAYAPDGTIISCAGSTTKCFQEGITYAQTNHFNFKANCANNDGFLSFTGALSFGPGTSIFYDLTGCSVAFSGFTGDAIKIDTLNQGSHLKWTAGYITSTATSGSAVITFNPHTAAPGGGTAFQGSRVDFPYVLAGATLTRGVVFFEAVTATYSIANGNIFTFSLLDGNAGGFFAPACIVVENTPNSSNAFVQNIIDFTSCQNAATTGVKIGTTTPTGPIGTNIWKGMIGVGTAQTFGIETFGQLDQFYLSSVSVNAGSLTTGIIFRTGANHNYIIAPQMEGALDVNDGGTGNCGVINAKQKSCGSSW